MPTPPYRLVSLLIGVNNQYLWRPVDEYRMQLRALIERAVAYADGQSERVIELSIPDWGVTPFAATHGRDAAVVATEIDAYNAVKQAECARAGVAYVDITGLTREAATRRELLADDGLHPSAIESALGAGSLAGGAGRDQGVVGATFTSRPRAGGTDGRDARVAPARAARSGTVGFGGPLRRADDMRRALDNQRTHNACENVNELRVPKIPNEKAHTEEFHDSQQNNQLEEKVSRDQRGNLASRNPHGSTR